MRLLLLCAALPALSWAAAPLDSDRLAAEAASLIPPFQQQLLQTVQQAVASGGPTAAVEACQVLAPQIAEQHSQSPWRIGRTALRLRNPANQADAWERQVLEDFARRSQAGEPLAQMRQAAVVNGEHRYMQAIATGEPCLACHGSQIKAPVAALLDQRYPQDQARGFQLGELRGAFTLRRPISEVQP